MKKKLTTEQFIKIINLSPGMNFVIRKLFKNNSFTEDEWIKRLKEKNIL